MPADVQGQSTAESGSDAQDSVSNKDEKSAKDGKSDWKTLKGKWKACQFGGEGAVEFKDGVVKMEFGDPLTGIRWEGDVLKENYEVELEARRTDGFDFFCGLTFPVGKDHVSFILGGWGGGVVGISSIDGQDASENSTTSFRNFDNDKWYKVRVRVEPNKITCWIDDKVACDTERKDIEFDIRYEMDPCTPLGIAAFQCKSELRNIRMRKIVPKQPEGK
ncbi:MAG: family 16 glycoside hydrolase [Planctomycetota bacterium]